MARHGMLSILSEDAPVSDCVELQEIMTNTSSRESQIRFEGLLRLVENVWETSSQISGKYMAYHSDVIRIVKDVLTECVWHLQYLKKQEMLNNIQSPAAQ